MTSFQTEKYTKGTKQNLICYGEKTTKTGKKLEKQVAEAYRKMGARKVEHDVELAGNQIDLYVQLETPGRLVHRIAVEAKDWASPVGIDVVNQFATIVALLRGDRLIDEGVIVSAKGCSKQARNVAKTHGLILLEPADLEAMVDEASGHRELGRLLIYRGAFDNADDELSTAFSMFNKLNLLQSECVVWAYRALCALLMGNNKAAYEAICRAHEIAISRHNEYDCIRAEWLMGATSVVLSTEAKGDKNKFITEAEAHLTEAITRCRRINMVDHEPDILLAWAQWFKAKGKQQEAKRNAEEALVIADRCEYRLQQADIHNFLAQLAVETGNREAAQKHAATAHERAWCDGPPHCSKPALKAAKRLLKELGVKPPRV